MKRALEVLNQLVSDGVIRESETFDKDKFADILQRHGLAGKEKE